MTIKKKMSENEEEEKRSRAAQNMGRGIRRTVDEEF